MVLAGAGLAAPTTVMRPTRAVVPPPAAPPPYATAETYYEYDEPPRRRAIWPWLLAIGLVIAAAVAGWYVWTQIQDQLNANSPVTVPLVKGLKQDAAEAQLEGVGLRPVAQYRASQTVERGFVISQNPDESTKTDKGNPVTIVVSNGKPKTKVPAVVGDNIADAIAALTQAHLTYEVFEINSPKEPNTVIATAPPADAVVLWNTKVRVNVSKGPKPVAIPNGLVGQPYANVLGALQGAGFAVKRGPDAESDLPKDTVVSTDPPPGTAAPPGSTVTVTVSKGPKTTGVPDVTSYSQDGATTTLESAGFKPVVITTPTSDPTLDGFVISQDPPPDTQVKPGAKVKIVVGDLATQPTTTAAPTTTAPPPPATTTTATPTVPTTTG